VPGGRNISGNMVLFPCSWVCTLSSSSYVNEFSVSCITVEVTWLVIISTDVTTPYSKSVPLLTETREYS
jgi:hypothetical protein